MSVWAFRPESIAFYHIKNSPRKESSFEAGKKGMRRDQIYKETDCIFITVIAGTTPEEAVSDGIRIAKRKKRPVIILFNCAENILIRVDKRSDVVGTVELLHKAIEGGSTIIGL